MGKEVVSIGLVVAAIAIPFAAPAIAGFIGIAGALSVSAAVAGGIVAGVLEVGLALASTALLGPAVPAVPGSLADGGLSRLYATLGVNEPRKIVFGVTALATDVRYQTESGTDQEYVDQIVCCASHKVQAIDEIWLDNEKVWSTSGGVIAKYSGYLTVTTRTEGTNANGIAIDANWTANATLTGCAYVYLRYKRTGPDQEHLSDSPFFSGISNRMTIRGKGAFIYDPRLDSTVAGGSGTQRAATQSTWTWDANASCNPALQLLWYLLGWEINGKLAVGMGMPPARIDLASFAVAANLCDESIALNGGGTEPRYRTHGVLSEGDDRRAVVEALCASMNAVLRDAGGQLALTVFHNDLATPVTPSGRSAFDERDVTGEVQWDQTPDLNAIFNITRGTRTDPSDNALYQPVEYPEVSLTSPDGIDRIDSVDFPLVQSNGQAVRLAKQRLERNQYQGRLQFTGGPTFWGISLGQVFAFSFAPLGWSGKLFRCAGHKMSRGGTVDIVAVEENAAIYAWDNSEAAPVTAGTPTVYNQANLPIVLALDGVNAALAAIGTVETYLTNESHTVATAADGSGGDFTNAGGTFKVFDGTTDVTTLSAFSVVSTTGGLSIGIGAATGIYTPTALTSDLGTAVLQAVYNGVTLQRIYSIAKSKAGTNGSSAKLLYIYTDRQLISYDNSGSPSPSSQTTTFTIAPQALSSGTYTISMTRADGTTINANTYLTASSGSFSASGNNIAWSGSGTGFTMTAANFNTARGSTNGVIVSISHVDGVGDKISIVKTLAGSDGANGVAITVNPVALTVACTSAGTVKAGEFNKTAQITVMNGATNVTTSATYGTPTFTGCTGSVNSSTGAITFTGISADTATCSLTVTYGTASQTITVVMKKVRDGADGSSSGSSGVINLDDVSGGTATSMNIAVTSGTLYFDGDLFLTVNAGTGGNGTLKLYDETNTLVATIGTVSLTGTGNTSAAFTTTSVATGIAAGVWKQWKLEAQASGLGVGASAEVDTSGVFHQ